MDGCLTLSNSTEDLPIDNGSIQANSTSNTPHKHCGINSDYNKYQSPSKLILFTNETGVMKQSNTNNKETETIIDEDHSNNVTNEETTENGLIEHNDTQDTIETFESANNDNDVTTTIQEEGIKTKGLSKNIISITSIENSNNIASMPTPFKNIKNKDKTLSQNEGNNQQDSNHVLESNTKLESTIEKLEKESFALKLEMNSLKKELEAERRSNSKLKNDLIQKNDGLKEKEQSIEKLNSNLSTYRANFFQLEESVREIKKLIHRKCACLKQQITDSKAELIGLTSTECHALQTMYQKKMWAKKSFNNTLTTAMTTIDGRIKDLAMKEGKKIAELKDNLNEKEFQLEQLRSIVNNLRLFDINLRETIETMVEYKSISSAEEDKKSEFQQAFNRINPNITGFRTTDDSVLVNDIQKTLSHIKRNFRSDFVKDLQNIITESNSNRDDSWLELHKNIEELQQIKCSQSNKLLNLEKENDLLKQQLQQLVKVNSTLKTEMSTQSDTINQTNQRLQTLLGDEQMRITFEQILLNNKNITKEAYDILEVDRIDDLTIIELQNVIKNLIIFLNIPFSKMTQKIPLIGIYLMYERNIYAHFANRLYYQINGIQISLSDFNREVYSQYTITKTLDNIKHPLEPCLDNLCASIITKL